MKNEAPDQKRKLSPILVLGYTTAPVYGAGSLKTDSCGSIGFINALDLFENGPCAASFDYVEGMIMTGVSTPNIYDTSDSLHSPKPACHACVCTHGHLCDASSSSFHDLILVELFVLYG